MAKRNKEIISDNDTSKYEMLAPIFTNLLNEVRELSKKKPDGVLNNVKVKMINKVLEQLKDLLSTESGVQFVDTLDEETLPSNSDAVIMLAQFESVMKQFYDRHHCKSESGYGKRWATKENPAPTYEPY